MEIPEDDLRRTENSLQPPIQATDEELRVARAICEADFHVWPDDTYNGRAQIRQFLKLARAAIAIMT